MPLQIHGGEVRADTTGASYILVPCYWKTTDLLVWSTAIKLWHALPLVTSQWIEVCLMSARLYPVEGRLAELLFRPLSSFQRSGICEKDGDEAGSARQGK